MHNNRFAKEVTPRMRRSTPLTMLGVLALATAGCSNGGAGALPYAAAPNAGGGTSGTYQSGATSTALLRFVNGSPDFSATTVDVCVDGLPLETAAPPPVAYGAASPLYGIAGGITHTVSVYQTPAFDAGGAGAECPTAPGPYFGSSAISVTTIAPGIAGNAARETIVLGGTAASNTLGLYVFGEPSFAVAPTSDEAISHNAAPVFSATTPAKSVGFGYVASAASGPSNLAGAQSVAAPSPSKPTASVINTPVQSSIPAVPVSFFDGSGVPTGPVVPLTTVPAPAQAAGAPYVVALYAIDTAGGIPGLVAVREQVTGYGF